MAHKRRKLDIDERQTLLKEYEAGLIIKAEYRKLRLGSNPSQNSDHSRSHSPEWNYNQLNEDMETSDDFSFNRE